MDKIRVYGDLVAICPECGNEIQITVSDLINEREILCPCGKFTAHPDEHATTYAYCGEECIPSFDRHTFTLSKSLIEEY